MNIFILDEDVEKSVEYYVDSHVVKICLEVCQVLCSVHHLTGTDIKKIPYKLSYKNHPVNIWARRSLSNYIWACKVGKKLCKEYTYRYDKIHKCEKVVDWCIKNLPNIPDVGMTEFFQAMPDECKDENPVKAYRKYYNKNKKHLFKWKKREIPYWIE